MVAREKPPNHVGAHAAESDHSELHHRLLCRADCSTSSVSFPKRAKSAARIDGASFTVGLAILPLTCWTLRKCAEWTRPAGRRTRHRIAGPTVPLPAPAKSSPRRLDSCASVRCPLSAYSHPPTQPPARPCDG